VKLFRTLSTPRLLGLIAAVVAAAIAGTIAVAARGGGGGEPPPKKTLDAQAGSALLGSATGRLWVNATGGRLELQSDAGDTQITWNDKTLTVYDASSNTAYVADLPQQSATSKDNGAVPSLDRITTVLSKLGAHWAISGAVPSNVGGQEAYTVTVSPKQSGGLLGSAELAWDALHGTPLKVAVYPRGATKPVLGLEVTSISFGSVPDADVSISPPAGTKIVDLSTSQRSGGQNGVPPVTGLPAVQAAAPFTVVAPDSLNGLTRQDVRLVGPTDARSVVAVYGQGLGAIVVVERQAQASSGQVGGTIDALPGVLLDGVTAHELATPLGTLLAWNRDGVSYILAGSVLPAAAESAARALK
jgi:outer membrane lipoprotein-sorting protein